MFNWLKAHLIDECVNWWRMWSVRLAAVGSIAVGYVLASPDVLLSTINALPPEMRTFLPPATGMVLFGVVTIVRLWKQGSKPNG